MFWNNLILNKQNHVQKMLHVQITYILLHILYLFGMILQVVQSCSGFHNKNGLIHNLAWYNSTKL